MDAISSALVECPSASPEIQSDKKAVDRWINEGGRFTDLQALREAVRVMDMKLLADFTNGLVGEHHNTFQHRSRVLRQLTARLHTSTTQSHARLAGSA